MKNICRRFGSVDKSFFLVSTFVLLFLLTWYIGQGAQGFSSSALLYISVGKPGITKLQVTFWRWLKIHIPIDADFQSQLNGPIFIGNGWKMRAIIYNSLDGWNTINFAAFGKRNHAAPACHSSRECTVWNFDLFPTSWLGLSIRMSLDTLFRLFLRFSFLWMENGMAVQNIEVGTPGFHSPNKLRESCKGRIFHPNLNLSNWNCFRRSMWARPFFVSQDLTYN